MNIFSDSIFIRWVFELTRWFICAEDFCIFNNWIVTDRRSANWTLYSWYGGIWAQTEYTQIYKQMMKKKRRKNNNNIVTANLFNPLRFKRQKPINLMENIYKTIKLKTWGEKTINTIEETIKNLDCGLSRYVSMVLSAGFNAACVSSPQLFIVSSSSNRGLYDSDFAFEFTLIFRCMSEMYLYKKSRWMKVKLRHCAWFRIFSIKCGRNCEIFVRKFTQSLNRVRNVPNRLDNVDALLVAVYHGYTQRDDL